MCFLRILAANAIDQQRSSLTLLLEVVVCGEWNAKAAT
jgi:hypothetical protein